VSEGLAEVLAAIEGVEGWLSEDQASRLFDRARAVVPGGTIVEIGSFRGRSTIVLARGAPENVAVYAIDPHGGTDRGPREIRGQREQGEADRTAFEANLARAGASERVTYLRVESAGAIGQVTPPVDLVYVDGAHRYGPARADLAGWGGCVRPGGAMLVHDAFSSIGVTLAIFRVLAFGRNFVYAGRTRSLAEYRRASGELGAGARARNASRQLAQLPWFLRNVAIKLALVMKLRRVALALGHDRGQEWPF
jgi:hypothetical protein